MMKLIVTGDTVKSMQQQIVDFLTTGVLAALTPKEDVPPPPPAETFTPHPVGVPVPGLAMSMDPFTEAAGLVQVDQGPSPAEVEVKKNKGRPKTAHLQAVADLQAANPPEIQPAPLPQPTQQDAVTAVSAVLAKFGMDHARQVLAKFGVKKIGEMKPGEYGDFITHCETVVAGDK